MKKLIVFDLDGTLTESKSSIDKEMVDLLHKLLRLVKVAVIGGGDWPQFETQLLSHIPTSEMLEKLYILPTSGTKFYKYHDGWTKVYSEDFSTDEKILITTSLNKVLAEADFEIPKIWGEAIEDRGSQITFSALGQQAPLREKEKWDPDFAKRKKMKSQLDVDLPGFSIRLGGTTSIDITKQGIDKAYGIGKLRDMLGIKIEEMVFVGDALFPGGNDFAVKEAGVVSIGVSSVTETKLIIETMTACLEK
jgi:phosphomannomutase